MLRINISRNNLNHSIQNRANRAAIRSRRACWVEFVKKSSKYFVGLEKYHCDKKLIISLKNVNGSVIYNQQLILRELVNFYEKLYNDNLNTSDTQNCKFDKMLLFPTINGEEKIECDKPTTKSECLKAIYQLANNKSPGLDGFFVEFHETFCQDFKYLFLNALISSLLPTGCSVIPNMRDR